MSSVLVQRPPMQQWRQYGPSSSLLQSCMPQRLDTRSKQRLPRRGALLLAQPQSSAPRGSWLLQSWQETKKSASVLRYAAVHCLSLIIHLPFSPLQAINGLSLLKNLNAKLLANPICKGSLGCSAMSAWRRRVKLRKRLPDFKASIGPLKDKPDRSIDAENRKKIRKGERLGRQQRSSSSTCCSRGNSSCGR